MKIGSVTPIYNNEKFIIPHFTMLTKYVDKPVVVLGNRPWPTADTEYGISHEPDRSEQLLKKFPVQILPARIHDWHADLINQGLEQLQDCDVVIKIDVDMFLEDKNWQRLLAFIEQTKAARYQLDWSKCTINYYQDFAHGIQDAKEHDLIAMAPTPIANVNDPGVMIDWDDFHFHHFKGWKGKMSHDNNIEQFFPDAKWITCPNEIKNLFKLNESSLR